MQECHLSPEDTSHSRSTLLYSVFAVAGLATITVTFGVAPAMIFADLGACRLGSLCTSLEGDLLASRRKEVHPCDDFYEHVCSGWDSTQAQKYKSPLTKYESSFELQVVKKLLESKIPSVPRKSEDKASFLLLRCLSTPSRSDTGSQLGLYLKNLRLSWPHKSPASRQQIMNILLQASLDYGLPAIWAFYVGRHPSKPSENTIYLDLTTRVKYFFRDLDTLQAEGSVHRYFRRCAEIIGGTGQSYSSMIDDIIGVHQSFLQLVALHRDELREPSYMNLADGELRRAINGHLPDNSQLWMVDEIVNLQPELFKHFDNAFLRTAASRQMLKLYIGAFIVWDLSPLAYRYLTTHMLADMKNSEFEVEYVARRCLDALRQVVPLVAWKVNMDLVKDKSVVFQELALVKDAVRRYGLGYGEDVASRFADLTKQITVNAFNSSATSALLDKAYDFFNVTLSGHFFHIFLKATSTITTYFKNSLLRPQHNIVHLQGVSEINVYRVVALREATVKSYSLVPPMTLPAHPIHVKAALIASVLASDILLAINYVFLYDSNFKEIKVTELPSAGLQEFLKDLEYVHNHMGHLTSGMFFHPSHVLQLSISGLAAALALSAHNSSTTHASSRMATNTPEGFEGVPSDQLFFLVRCFVTCGRVARVRHHSKALCNVALPAANGFSQAFGCSPSQPLASNFTWK
ncbi:unnamed protein product, partial [Ixodes hexagonus]